MTFVPLFIAFRGQTPKRAALIGLFSGFIMSWEGFWWLNEMLKNFSGFNVVLCGLFTTILCAFQAGRYALMGWIYARASQRGWPASLVACGAFVASEQLFPLLFPWYLADCVHSMPTFAQSADLGGPVFCGLLLFGSSLALEEIVVAKLFEKRKVNAPVVVAGFLATALSAVYGFVRVRQIDARAAAAPQVHVGYAQSNLGLMQNYTQPEQAMARNLRLTKELRDKGTELVIWSESSVTRGASANAYKSFYKGYVGQRTGVPTIFGGIIFDSEPGQREARASLQHRPCDQRARRRHRALRQGVLARVRRVPSVRRDLPGPLRVVTEQRPLQAGHRARSDPRRDRRAAPQRVRLDLLRGHHPVVREPHGLEE